MLILSQYDVRLIRVQAEHLSLILRWRNNDWVRKNMFVQDILQEKDQLAWFNSINNASNYYFIIEVKNLVKIHYLTPDSYLVIS